MWHKSGTVIFDSDASQISLHTHRKELKIPPLYICQLLKFDPDTQ